MIFSLWLLATTNFVLYSKNRKIRAKFSTVDITGTVNEAYYNDRNLNTRGLLDYALITDFSKKDNSIQLNGKADNYLLDEAYLLGGSAGTSIFRKDTVNELIGFVEGVKGLTLNSNDFSFTGQPPDHCKNML